MTAHSGALVYAILGALAMNGCDRKGEGGGHGEAQTASSASGPRASTFTRNAASSASAPLATSAGVTSTRVASLSAFSGKYDARVAPVRTPSDAPPFISTDTGALGPGEITLMLPDGDGPVAGHASGALGVQVFSGLLETGRLTGTISPERRGEGAASDPASDPPSSSMWGFVVASVEGDGAARTVAGTLRVSGADGRVVREATFTLKAASGGGK